MIELAEIRPGELLADLGSGDGRIIIESARSGIQSVGYELDAELAKRSRELIREEHLHTKACIIEKDFWAEDLSPYDIITVYPMPGIMKTLEDKLKSELKPGSRILLNYFPFPKWKYKETKDKIYLYRI